MQTSVIIEYWERPIFEADPSGFDYIEIRLHEPSQHVHVKATISLENARKLADRLIQLSNALAKAEGKG